MERLKDSIVSSLPSFWRDSFTDRDFLDGIAYSIGAVCSDLYTRVMATIPASSIKTCPLELRPERQVLNIRSSNLVPLSDGKWAYSLPAGIRQVTVLRAKTPSGSYTLFNNEDFEVFAPATFSNNFSVISDSTSTIVFNDNPFSWEETGLAVGNTIERPSLVESNYFLRRPIAPTSVYDSIESGDYIFISEGESYTECKVALVVGEEDEELPPGIYLYTSTPAPYEGTIQIASTPEGLSSPDTSESILAERVSLRESHIFLVAISPIVDRFYLWNNYGRLLGDSRRPSSEDYKLELQGRMLLATEKFSRRNLKCAISYFLGLPVLGDVDEIIINVETLDNGSRIITTNNTRSSVPSQYTINPVVTNHSLRINGNRNTSGTKVASILSDLEPAVDTYDVFDISEEDSSWWKTGRLVLKDFMVPYPTEERCTVGDGTLVENNIGGADGALVGDYTVVAGALYRHKIAYGLTRDFYAHKIIVVSKPAGYTGATLSDAQVEYIQGSAPSNTTILFHEDA